ncbi:uncharacterized protein TNCV_2808701 [Trichonephila clavipes]|nr:uncharacterized protein TNCV_2808701 [Trichonephila clavipes]
MEAGCSARRVVRQLGCSDYVVKRCRDQWIRMISFTRRPGSGHPLTDHCSRRTPILKEMHLYSRLLHRPSIQVQVAPSMGTLCLLEPYEGTWLKDIWDRGTHYECCP